MPGAAAIFSTLPARRAFAGRWIRGAGFRPRVLQSLQRDAAVLGLRAEAQFVYVVDDLAEVVAALCPVVVNLAILALGCGPLVPAVGLVEKEGVLFAVEGGFIGFVLLEGVEVFQEKRS